MVAEAYYSGPLSLGAARGDFVGGAGQCVWCRRGGQGETAVGSDIAVWLDAFDEGDLPQPGWRYWLFGLSPARETMAALRQVGVLDEVIETKEGLVVYPTGLEAGSV